MLHTQITRRPPTDAPTLKAGASVGASIMETTANALSILANQNDATKKFFVLR